jgi:hypothetical protein
VPRRIEVVASTEADEVRQVLELSTAAAGPLVHVTTDRPVYRPGEPGYVRAVVLDRVTMLPLKNTPPLQARLLDSKGAPVQTGHDGVPETGVGSFALVVPPDSAGGPHDAGSSCWVRVAQFWAGKRFGAFFWPRIGQEVVIAFEDGDPDRPLIVGSVYNSANMPPLEMPADEKITGIKSCIYGGDPLKNFNAVIFHDTPGNEYVQVHSETHAMQNSKSDHYEFVPSVHFSFHGSLM